MKIFIFCDPHPNGDVEAYAIAEDGNYVAEHYCSNRVWARFDMGLTSKQKHGIYTEAYPEGYELVDLVDLTPEQLDAHKELNKAFDRGTTK